MTKVKRPPSVGPHLFVEPRRSQPLADYIIPTISWVLVVAVWALVAYLALTGGRLPWQ